MSTTHSTKNSLSKATRTKVNELLNQSLADLSDLYSQTKQAHWNVRGPSFIALHKLFDDLADAVEEHIDPVAERITALGGEAEGTVRMAAKASALPEFPGKLGSDLAFVDALIERFAKVANSVRAQVDDTAKLGDTGSSDLLTGVSRALDQALWMLEAHRR
jgi:starvation-inducible DNA-binding protein